MIWEGINCLFGVDAPARNDGDKVEVVAVEQNLNENGLTSIGLRGIQ